MEPRAKYKITRGFFYRREFAIYHLRWVTRNIYTSYNREKTKTIMEVFEMKTMELTFNRVEDVKMAADILEEFVFDMDIWESDLTIYALGEERKLKASKAKLAHEGVSFKGGRVC